MDWMILLLLVGGLVVLVFGAEVMVRGAARLAAAVGISPLVIGLTVVAFGTSSPEMAINIQAAFVGSSDLALGNVVGSNIFNILVILGLSAVIVPLIVHQQLIRLDVPLMIGLSFIVWLMSLDGVINRLDGFLLFAGLVAYIVYSIRQSKKESAEVQEEYDAEFNPHNGKGWKATLMNLGMIAGGVGLLVLGSNWLVDGATQLARIFGVSDLLIGLTIVALGTSLPEVATSVVAALKNERDIAVGNAVGSNIFNIMAVLGVSGIIAPNGIPVQQTALTFDIPVMIGVAIVTLPIFFTNNIITRGEGVFFLLYYVAYTTYIVLDATQNIGDLLPFEPMWIFVVPMVLIAAGYTVHRFVFARGSQN
jgi:cation:H+ antiporter